MSEVIRPLWSIRVTVADHEVKAAQRHMRAAFALRCQEKAPNAQQCTADAEPANHVHRHNKEELPW